MSTVVDGPAAGDIASRVTGGEVVPLASRATWLATGSGGAGQPQRVEALVPRPALAASRPAPVGAVLVSDAACSVVVTSIRPATVTPPTRVSWWTAGARRPGGAESPSSLQRGARSGNTAMVSTPLSTVDYRTVPKKD